MTSTWDPMDVRAADPEEAAAPSLLDHGWPAPVPLPSLDGIDVPADRIRAVAEGDFTILGIPEQFGGLGHGLAGVAGAQRQLARLDPSIAIALNMHSLTVGLMADYWDEHRDKSWMLL